ncbi:MAG: hypothetical protein ACK56I_29850, partial [bacterium]
FNTGKGGIQGQPHVAFVLGNHRLHIEGGAVVQHHDDRLLGHGEVADDRLQTDHEGTLGEVIDAGKLSIEHGYLGSLKDVGAAITLRGLQEEEQLQIAQDGEAQLRCSPSVDGTKGWRRGRKVALTELKVEGR